MHEAITESMRREYGQPSYGFFLGGDPRNFTPAPEVCTPKELESHKEDCEAWSKGNKIETEAGSSRYGLGVNEKGIYG